MSFISEAEELPRVMREIADALGGAGAALTIHPGNGKPPRLIFADREAGVSRGLVERLLGEGRVWPEDADKHLWLRCGEAGRFREAMSLPVQRVPGHSRLVVTVFFERLTAAARAEAESAYLGRRPFAVGYFRLWQVERAQGRRLRATEEALDLVDLAVAILSAEGRVLHANRAARALFANGEGLRERDGRLAAPALTDTVRLQAAIGHVLHSGTGVARRAPLLAMPREGKPPLVVSVLPTSTPAEEPGDAAASVFAVDPATDVAAMLKPVSQLFRLSNVEAELATLLATGSTLGEAAAAMRVKEPTARSYLRQIFGKTETNRQTDLVRLMLLSLMRTSRGTPFEVV